MLAEKKPYKKPKIETVALDNEISLIMMSEVPESPPDPNLPGGPPFPGPSSNSTQTYKLSSDNYTFRGSSPEY